MPIPHQYRKGAKRGVVVVIAAHVSFALTMGIVRCGGLFYLSWQREFESSPKEVAVAQSIVASLMCFAGILSGPVTKRFGCRFSEILGGALVTIGNFGWYWVTNMQQLYIAATVVGLGTGFTFNASIVVVAQYFHKNYKIANAIAISGCGTGIIAMPPLFQSLMDRYGWRETLLVTSAISANMIALGLLFHPPAIRRQTTNVVGTNANSREPGDSESMPRGRMRLHNYNRALTEDTLKDGEDNTKRSAFNTVSTRLSSLGMDAFLKSYRLVLLCIIEIEIDISYGSFFLFIVPRAAEVGTDKPLISAALLISAAGVGSLAGRVFNGFLISWKVSTENIVASCLFVGGISLNMVSADSYAVLMIAAVLQGFTSGNFYTAQSVLVRKFVGLERFAVCMGLLIGCGGIGFLIGPVCAGMILESTDSYKMTFNILSGMYYFGALQAALIPLLERIEPGFGHFDP